MFAPTIFEAENAFQLLVSVENIFVFFVVLRGFVKNLHKPVVVVSVLVLLVCGGVLSMIVVNDGALTRYIYPLKASMVVFLYYCGRPLQIVGDDVRPLQNSNYTNDVNATSGFH